MPVPEDEERAFQAIVAQFRARRRARWSLATGVAFLAVAGGFFLFGGVKGAVLAVPPWLIGIVLVVRSRFWR